MRITNIRSVFLTMTLLILSGCQTNKLETAFDASVDFNALKTFTWSAEHPMLVATVEPVNPTFEGHIMRATRTELERRGLRYVSEPEQADMLVSFAVGREQIRTGSQSETFEYSFATGEHEFVSHDFSESQLGVNMLDTQSRQLIWHGSLRKGVKGSDQADIVSLATEVIDEILSEFPPAK